jgi:hypothetical protein
MNAKKFFAELKRRKIYKVAVAYAIVGWLLVQIATQVFPQQGSPLTMGRLDRKPDFWESGFYENNP